VSTAATAGHIREASPRHKARIAGVLYLLAVLVAVSGEFFLPGRLGWAAVVIPIACYAVMTLLLYDIFKAVNRVVCLLGVAFGLVGLALEALQWQPGGVNLAMLFHALYCLMIGYVAFRSTFLPRIPGALMMFAGFVWLIYLSPPLATHTSPYNTAIGLVGEASLMLWLLVMGVDTRRWKQQAGAAGERP